LLVTIKLSFNAFYGYYLRHLGIKLFAFSSKDSLVKYLPPALVMEEGGPYGAAVFHFQSGDENVENYQPPDPSLQSYTQIPLDHDSYSYCHAINFYGSG
jgi:hypothetical protein